MTVVLSPHLDDAAFSCGGYLAGLGRPAHVVTTFTKSVANPRGFALRCQTDKGIGERVDYMALRRREDEAAMRALNCTFEHWDLPEAPHRGYESAKALFAGPLNEDRQIVDQLIAKIHHLFEQRRPTTVLYPYGAGDHVDHLQLIDAVQSLAPGFPEVDFVQYFDQPYTSKFVDLAGAQAGRRRDIRLTDRQRTAKEKACGAYASQLGFQFGGAERMMDVLGHTEYLLP